ncbi:uncharacterized protein BKA78DRAFT_16143 [Phyllosticta capitalensis]|uniref:uncharacterized protein n=1 Tax=Phyllosticta capitalensis TaxID=121624 RepID=UPI0031302494
MTRIGSLRLTNKLISLLSRVNMARFPPFQDVIPRLPEPTNGEGVTPAIRNSQRSRPNTTAQLLRSHALYWPSLPDVEPPLGPTSSHVPRHQSSSNIATSEQRCKKRYGEQKVRTGQPVIEPGTCHGKDCGHDICYHYTTDPGYKVGATAPFHIPTTPLHQTRKRRKKTHRKRAPRWPVPLTLPFSHFATTQHHRTSDFQKDKNGVAKEKGQVGQDSNLGRTVGKTVATAHVTTTPPTLLYTRGLSRLFLYRTLAQKMTTCNRKLLRRANILDSDF